MGISLDCELFLQEDLFRLVSGPRSSLDFDPFLGSRNTVAQLVTGDDPAWELRETEERDLLVAWWPVGIQAAGNTGCHNFLCMNLIFQISAPSYSAVSRRTAYSRSVKQRAERRRQSGRSRDFIRCRGLISFNSSSVRFLYVLIRLSLVFETICRWVDVKQYHHESTLGQK